MAKQKKNYNLIIKEKGAAELKKVVSGLDKTNKSLRRVQKSSKSTAQSLSTLRTTFVGLIAVLSVREIARFSDEVQLLEDRLSVFANEGETGVEVLEQLNDVAQETRGSVIGLGEAYNRIAINTKDLGLSTKQLLDVTQALQQTFRLSGASSAEANSSIIQLTQGMAQGELRGQELRSVLEANAVFGGLLAKEMNSTRGELIKLGEAGKITTDVVLKVLGDNFEKLNEQAAQLRPTFEQGVIYGLNELRLQINELNKEFNLSGKFFEGMKFLAENIRGIGVAATTLIAGGSVVILTGQIVSLGKALQSLGALGILSKIGKAGIPGLILGTVAAGTVAAKSIRNFEDNVETIEDAQRAIASLQRKNEAIAKSNTGKQDTSILGGIKSVLFGKEAVEEGGLRSLKELDNGTKAIVKNAQKIASLQDLITKLQKPKKKKEASFSSSEKELTGLALLNKEYRDGVKNITEYRQAVFELQSAKINEQFEQGKINVDQMNESIEKLREQLKLVKEESFDLGKAIEDGSKNYIKSIGTLAEQISGAVSNTFSSLEDELVSFVQTGKFEFKSLVDSIIADLLRIAVRQAITAPLAAGISSAFSGASAGGGGAVGGSNLGVQPSAGAFAMGGAFQGGNVIPFATGGVVTGPTNFALSGGRTGLMGEAGAEGIVPLDRINGKLGVNASGLGGNVTVNVINNTDSEASVEEREGSNGEKILDVIIIQKVAESFGNGKMDKVMKQNYGISRRA